MNKLIALCVTACIGLTGCSTKLTPSQKWGVMAVGTTAAVNTIVANEALLSDEQLLTASQYSSLAKGYLDTAFEILTDGDPSNDNLVWPFLEAVEQQALPRLRSLGGAK